MPAEVERELERLLPGFHATVEQCSSSLQPFVYRFIGSTDVGEAGKTIVTQAVNDFLDLLFDISSGRGRPALRTARSLYEHATTLRDVSRDEAQADRYLAHLVVAKHWQSLLSLPNKSLGGPALQSLVHQQRKLKRDVKKPLANVIGQYGQTFKRQWSQLTFRDRVSQEGLTEHWPFYALSSAVLHGAAGGVIGLVDFSRYEHPVHRTGPALELCPIALLYGAEFFQLVLKDCDSVVPGSAEAPLAALASLRARWGDYRRVILEIDGQIWPDSLPRRLGAVLQIVPGGKRQWWLRDDANKRVARAHPPRQPLSAEQERSIALVESHMTISSKPQTIGFASVDISPRLPLKWEHAGRLLVQKPPGGWEMLGPINPINPRQVDT